MQLPALLERMDKDGDGQVSFEDFCETAVAMGLRPSSPDVARVIQHERLSKLFDSADSDNDGLLDSGELRNLLLGLGCHDMRQRTTVSSIGVADCMAQDGMLMKGTVRQSVWLAVARCLE